MIWNALEKYRDAGLLVLRLGFGLGFLYFHGWGKITGGPERWKGTGEAMSRLGIDFGHTFFGFLAAFSEAVGGVLIAAGLFFRPICIMLGFTMFVATVSHVASGQGNPGNAFKNVFVLAGLLLIGPGKYSVDAWLTRLRRPGGAA